LLTYIVCMLVASVIIWLNCTAQHSEFYGRGNAFGWPFPAFFKDSIEIQQNINRFETYGPVEWLPLFGNMTVGLIAVVAAGGIAEYLVRKTSSRGGK